MALTLTPGIHSLASALVSCDPALAGCMGRDQCAPKNVIIEAMLMILP
jgi:hypothetical protein